MLFDFVLTLFPGHSQFSSERNLHFERTKAQKYCQVNNQLDYMDQLLISYKMFTLTNNSYIVHSELYLFMFHWNPSVFSVSLVTTPYQVSSIRLSWGCLLSVNVPVFNFAAIILQFCAMLSQVNSTKSNLHDELQWNTTWEQWKNH